jgi:hypothetical protein
MANNEELRKAAQEINDQIKAKEAIIKNLTDEAKLAEEDSKKRIQAAKEAHEKEKAELVLAIAPLKDLKQDCEAVKRQLVKLSQDKLDAIAEVEAGKSVAVKKVNDVLREKQQQLAKIEMAIQKCKEAVASL